MLLSGLKLKMKKISIYIMIMVLQIIVILYWSNIKTNFFVDELYSLGYASNFTGEGDDARYISTSSDFRFNEWIENADLKKHLIMSDEEKAFEVAPQQFLYHFFTGRNYFGLLNVAESIAGCDYVSSKPAIILNIIFLILAEISLVSLMKKLKFDTKISYLSVAMFGFSCYVLSAALYIRFYMMVIMLMIMMLNALYKLWNSMTWRDALLSEITAYVLAFFAFKNSELTMVFFGSLMTVMVIAFIILKRWKHLIISTIFILVGIAYVALFTDYIGILFHPNNYSALGSVAVGASVNISNSSFDTVNNYALWVKNLFETSYFCNKWMLYLMIGMVTVITILHNERNWKTLREFNDKDNKLLNIKSGTACALIAWGVLYLFSCISSQCTAICLIVFIIILLIAINEATGNAFSLHKFIHSTDTSFICLILCSTVIYTVFCALCGYIGVWRYYCYGFVSLTIVVWYVLDRTIKCSYLIAVRNKVLFILTIFIVVNSAIPFETRNIDFLYEDEHEFISNVREHQLLDVVLFITVEDIDDNLTYSRHDLYDCVNLIPPKSHIYIVDFWEYEYEMVDYPNEFILWSHSSSDMKKILLDLIDHGYEIEDLGVDHCSHAIVCKLP